MDYSGVPQEGRGGAMPVAGFGWVGYLTPKKVMAVEPVQMQADAVPARDHHPMQTPPSFVPTGSAATSLTQVPEPGPSLFVGLALFGLVLQRRR